MKVLHQVHYKESGFSSILCPTSLKYFAVSEEKWDMETPPEKNSFPSCFVTHKL
jgi:hypothetical protein